MPCRDLGGESVQHHQGGRIVDGFPNKDAAKATTPAEEWGEPVDFLADADMTGAPELSPDHIPWAIAPFVFDTAARMGVDPAAVALCAIVSCAAVISDEWRIQQKNPRYHLDRTAAVVGRNRRRPLHLEDACADRVHTAVGQAGDRGAETARERMQRYRAELAE
jgi:hypothetical protein